MFNVDDAAAVVAVNLEGQVSVGTFYVNRERDFPTYRLVAVVVGRQDELTAFAAEHTRFALGLLAHFAGLLFVANSYNGKIKFYLYGILGKVDIFSQ